MPALSFQITSTSAASLKDSLWPVCPTLEDSHVSIMQKVTVTVIIVIVIVTVRVRVLVRVPVLMASCRSGFDGGRLLLSCCWRGTCYRFWRLHSIVQQPGRAWAGNDPSRIFGTRITRNLQVSENARTWTCFETPLEWLTVRLDLFWTLSTSEPRGRWPPRNGGLATSRHWHRHELWLWKPDINQMLGSCMGVRPNLL